MQAVKYYSSTSQELQPTVIIYSIYSSLISCFLFFIVTACKWSKMDGEKVCKTKVSHA